MEDKQEKPMYDFEDSHVDKLNDNHTDFGQMVKAKGSSFGEVKRNSRGLKKEGLKPKLLWEIAKSPINIAVAVIASVIAVIILAKLGF